MRSTSSSWQAMSSTRKRRSENPPPGLFTLHLRHGGRVIQTLPSKYIGGEVSTFTNMEEDEWGLVNQCKTPKVIEIWIIRGVVGADCSNDGSGEEYDVSGEEIGGSGEDDADFLKNTDLNVEYGGLGDVEVQNQDNDNSNATSVAFLSNSSPANCCSCFAFAGQLLLFRIHRTRNKAGLDSLHDWRPADRTVLHSLPFMKHIAGYDPPQLLPAPSLVLFPSSVPRPSGEALSSPSPLVAEEPENKFTFIS
nr:uncharacterized protein LOC109184816 [Ipomoea batatas]